MNGVREEAARWFIRMRNAEADDPVRGRFEAWLVSNPAHAREYSAFEEFWQRLDKPQSWEMVGLGMDRKREQRRRLLKSGLGAALLAVGGGGTAWWQWRHAAVWGVALHSEIGRSRQEILNDGSRLTLGAASVAEVSYSRAERRIALRQGEAAFDVARDAGSPFVVEAGDIRVSVLGTRFAVTRLTDRTRVSVDHGRVQLEAGSFWRRRILLQDGEVAEFVFSPNAEAQFARVRHDAAGAFAFEKGFIDLQNADLAEIATTFSRYRQAPVVLVGPSESASRVTASVNVADVEGFLQSLPRMASVDVHFEADGKVVIRQR